VANPNDLPLRRVSNLGACGNINRAADLAGRDLARSNAVYSHNYKVENVKAQIAETETRSPYERDKILGTLRASNVLLRVDWNASCRMTIAKQLKTLITEGSIARRYESKKSEVDATQRACRDHLQRVTEAGRCRAGAPPMCR